jgi:capsular exopolysaccharide synthesis family protein
LVIFGASGVIAFQPPPPVEYYSEGVLVDNSPLVALTATGPAVQQQGASIISEDLLLSDVLLEQVSAELKKRGIELSADDIASQTTIGLEVNENEASSRRAVVRFVWDDPKVTETTLNVLFQSTIELSRVTNKARLNAIMDALNERLPKVEGELREAEQDLEAYDRLEGPAIQAALDGSLLGAISGSQNQIRQNQITLAGLEAQMQSLQSQLGMSPEQAYASSALSADPIIASLRAQIFQAETQVELLKAEDYRSDHPSVVALQKSLQAYTDLLRSRAAEVIRGEGQAAPIPSGNRVRQDSSLDPARAALANQLVLLQTQRDALLQQQQVLAVSEGDLQQQYSGVPNKQLERGRLAQQVALKRALYDQIQARLVDAEAAEAETVSSLTVATPPYTLTAEQTAPNPWIVLLSGGLIGLVVGGGIVFLLDLLDGTARTTEDIEGILQEQEVPILGIIPPIRTRPAKAAPILVQSDSPYHQSYERFLSKLRLASPPDSTATGARVVLVTSTRDKEGKSVSAYNLAIAAARAGRRTLLVEADLRSASKARYLRITTDPQISTEPLRYYGGQIGNNICMVPSIENLYVSPSPGAQRQPAAIIESSEMRRFLEDVRGRFDMVILDTPALSRCDDALLLETQTDGMILVTRPEVTEKAVLTAALEELELNEEVRLLGAVINAAEVPLPEPGSEIETHQEAADELVFERNAGPVSVGPVDF